MRDQMKFINHIGEEIEFGKGCILINENDFRDYEWVYLSKNEKIVRFKRDIKPRNLPVIVCGEEANEHANKLFEIIEKDVIANKPGKMYIGNCYITGFFYAKSNSGYTKQNSIDISLKFVSDSSAWIKDVTCIFEIQQKEYETGLDYPFDYPYDYAPSGTSYVIWDTQHYAPSDFKLFVYGPCVNPIITVNGYPYQVFTTLAENEYFVLDSKEHTITKYMANGRASSLYNSRQFTPSVFAKIPGDVINVSWDGNFRFSITLFIERSEPKWHEKQPVYMVTEDGQLIVTENGEYIILERKE